MSSYLKIEDAIKSGITNMTVIRNNVSQDDGTDTLATGIDWFSFNSKQVDNLYISGNSWIGFGSSNEHLKVNRRDAKMYYLYKELGTVQGSKFLKIRWEGYSTYNYTSSSYVQAYDVFIFDTGQILLSFDTIPTSNFNGTNSLTCGSEVISYTPTSESRVFTFTPSDTVLGTGWSVAEGYPNLIVKYKSEGSVTFDVNLQSITRLRSSYIEWDAETPENTSINIEYTIYDGEEIIGKGTCDNKSDFLKTFTNFDFTEHKSSSAQLGFGLLGSMIISNPGPILHLTVTLSTSDINATPILKSIRVRLVDYGDNKVIVLKFGDEKNNNIRNAVGEVKVTYSGTSLKGENGTPIDPFNKTFIPEGLIPINNPNNIEHIEIKNITPVTSLMKINYTSQNENEHMELKDITIIANLTHVDDI